MAETAALVSLLLAAPALAQDEGVHIDPDSPGVYIDPNSPSAKEYQLPLESERRQADPSREPSADIVQGERSSPIFGTGIVSEGKSGDAGSSSRPRTKDGNAKEAERPPAPQDVERDDDAEILKAATSNPGAPGGGVSTALAIGGVAIGVLLLGGMAGLMLRRRA